MICFSLIRLSLFFLILVISSIWTNVIAVDFGLKGEAYEITEIDMEEYIMSQLKSLGEEKLLNHQKMIAGKVVKNIKRPRPVLGIAGATVNYTRYFDPSFIVEKDIYDHQHQLIHHHGKRINPLDYKAFDEIWLMINGDNEKELAFAKHYAQNRYKDLTQTTKDISVGETNKTKEEEKKQEKQGKQEKQIKIILVQGVPGEQEDGSFHYFDQFGEISKKLNITKTPSVIQ